MRRFRIFHLLLMITVLALTLRSSEVALAATPALQVSPLASARKALVDDIVATIQTNFAFPKKRDAVIERLRQGLASGRYDVDDHTFATRVTDDLLAVSDDKHLYLVNDPAAQLALSNTPESTAEALAAPGGVWAARFKRENYGLVEQKILEGNVRYLDTTGFAWTNGISAQAYDDAIRFLGGGDAIIIDLRRNGGGTPEAVRYLLSHFVKPDELLATFYERNKVTELRALRQVSAGRLLGKPLYVLISPFTKSAAEEFAYYVASHRIGEVVGEKSAGAGNISGLFPIAPGFVLSVSVARSVDPYTHSNWEGTGISPSIASPVSAALWVAHERALEKLSTTADTSARKSLVLDLRLAHSRVHPVRLSAKMLARYAGNYGDRHITQGADALRWKRGEQAEFEIQPLGGDWFALGDTGSQAHFQMANGRAISVTVSRHDGDGTAVARTR